MEKYVWEGSQSQRTVEQLLQRMPDREKAQTKPEVIEQYARNVTRFHNEGCCFFYSFFVCSRFTRSIALKLHLVFSSLSIKNVGEDAETINDYKESVKKLLGLQA
jgi:hypothetical protein